MKIEKAIQWFKSRKESITLGDTCTQAESLALEALQKEQERKNGWIPCSERVPAVRDGSLAYSELFLVTANIRDRIYTYLAYYSSCSGFTGLFGGDWNEHVTAWQPLPEPYKEGEPHES